MPRCKGGEFSTRFKIKQKSFFLRREGIIENQESWLNNIGLRLLKGRLFLTMINNYLYDTHTYFKGGLRIMKKGIHPKYVETDITCACGAVVHTRATKENIKVGICSKCHPFFTGKQKFIDSAGRVERFKRRYGLKK